MRRIEHGLTVPRLVIVALLVSVAGVTGAAPAPSSVACTDHSVPVDAPLGLPLRDLQISGTLCVPRSGASIVEVLVPGATYNRTYWDFPVNGYSYARDHAARGIATFAMDRLNTGASSTIPPAMLTIDVDANTVHQVIGALRDGEVGAASYDRVVLVGHSLGSTIAVQEAATYGDVDGVVLTGFSHTVNPSFAADLAALRVVAPPEEDDPSKSPHIRNQPTGEFTTRPGGRALYFYNAAQADPNVIQVDEDTKDVLTIGEMATFSEATDGPGSSLITAPVLFATAARDVIFHCGPSFCDSERDIRLFEEPRFTSAASFTPFVLPEAGHDLTLALNHDLFFDAAASWVTDTVTP